MITNKSSSSKRNVEKLPPAKVSLKIFYSLAGVSLTLTMFIPLGYFSYEWPILVLNLIGKSIKH